MKHAPIPEAPKNQVLLPKKHCVVDMILSHYHELSGHSGREHVLALIRQKYSIVGGKRVISSISNNCVMCRRCNAKPGVQKRADLPENHVTLHNPPFTSVGIDYFGPFMVRRACSLVKRYGCIFT